MIISEMCFRKKKAAQTFLGLTIGYEKQTCLSWGSCNINTLLLKNQ